MLYPKSIIKFPTAKEMKKRSIDSIFRIKNERIEEVKNDISNAAFRGKFRTNYFIPTKGTKADWDETMEYFIKLGYKVTYCDKYDYYEINWGAEE